MDLELKVMKLDLEETLDEALKEHVERRLRFSLGRFASRIGRVEVRLTDVNGPRGGVDKRCRVTVSLIPKGKVIVVGSGHNPFGLVSRVAKRIGGAVRRELDRKRWACA